MKENPYSSPDAMPVDDKSQKSLICTIMFWLSCIVCVGMLGIAANGSVQYWYYSTQMGMQLPTHILIQSICVACAGLGMFYSAVRWRRQWIGAGSLSFVASLIVFFGGPLLMM